MEEIANRTLPRQMGFEWTDMIASTFLAIFFVPVFYVVFQTMAEWWSGPPEFSTESEGEHG